MLNVYFHRHYRNRLAREMRLAERHAVMVLKARRRAEEYEYRLAMGATVGSANMITAEERVIQDCWKVALVEGRASITLFMRKLKLDRETAREAMQALEARGLVTRSPDDEARSRVLRISSWSRQCLT